MQQGRQWKESAAGPWDRAELRRHVLGGGGTDELFERAFGELIEAVQSRTSRPLPPAHFTPALAGSPTWSPGAKHNCSKRLEPPGLSHLNRRPCQSLKGKGDLLRGARVYLSGPMDFVLSRAAEKQSGWRNRVSHFLQEMDVTVFDPWFKPDVRGLHEYGREDVKGGDRIRAAVDLCRRQGRRAGPVVVRQAVLGDPAH